LRVVRPFERLVAFSGVIGTRHDFGDFQVKSVVDLLNKGDIPVQPVVEFLILLLLVGDFRLCHTLLLLELVTYISIQKLTPFKERATAHEELAF
jgi:hypothetical protein